MSIPFKCPVCNGTGTVLSDFYAQGTTTVPSVLTNPLTVCKACSGSGIVWSPNIPTPNIPYIPSTPVVPQWPTYPSPYPYYPYGPQDPPWNPWPQVWCKY